MRRYTFHLSITGETKTVWKTLRPEKRSFERHCVRKKGRLVNKTPFKNKIVYSIILKIKKTLSGYFDDFLTIKPIFTRLLRATYTNSRILIKLWQHREISDTVLKRYTFMERITWEIIYNTKNMIIAGYSNIITTIAFAQSFCGHFMEVNTFSAYAIHLALYSA